MRARATRFRAGILVFALASAATLACSQPPPPTSNDDVGTIGFALQVAPGVTINSISWNITNTGTTFTRGGAVNVQNSNTIRFQIGGLPPGAGYTISLTGTSVGGAFSCAGSVGFAVAAGMINPVAVALTCTAVAPGTGTVVVSGTTAVCATITELSAFPLETTVNGSVALAATATAGSLTPTFAWTATAGSFDNPAIAAPMFTCPATPALVTVTLAVSPTAPGCTSATQSVEINCDTLIPTFTNVYANVISQRCVSCHRPGGSGVNTGMLDMSTQAAAYANLVGVTSAGTGAGTSGVTCAAAALPRVQAGMSGASLLFTKVNSKLAGALAPCGSPMPLPGGAPALLPAQVDLIAGWIDVGALND
jgi:mono/diheme cytochrome c family protein